MSKVSISKVLFILALFFSINLNAKEKLIGYFDSLAVLKDLPTFDWIENKLNKSILLEMYRKDIEEIMYHHELMTEELDSLRPTLTEEEIEAREKNIDGYQVMLNEKQKDYNALFETKRQEELELIRISFRTAIDTTKKRLKLGQVIEIGRISEPVKSTALDVTAQIREELFRLESERCI